MVGMFECFVGGLFVLRCFVSGCYCCCRRGGGGGGRFVEGVRSVVCGGMAHICFYRIAWRGLSRSRGLFDTNSEFGSLL